MSRQPIIVLLPALIITAAFLGCGPSEVTGVANPSATPVAATPAIEIAVNDHAIENSRGNFFPIAVGNRWELQRKIKVTVVTDSGTEVTDIETVIKRELVGTVTMGDQEYTVQQEDEDGSFMETRYRQDRSGLYEREGGASPSLSSRPRQPTALETVFARARGATPHPAIGEALDRLQRRASILRTGAGRLGGAFQARPGGVLDNEIARLAYPLTRGTSWVIRDTPRFESFVEGWDHLDLPAGRVRAARIQIDSELFDPADEARVWFGRCGQVAFAASLNSIAFDSEGNEVGTVLFEETQELVDLELSDRRSCTHGGP